MKRFISWILVMLLAFTLGVVTALLWFNRSSDNSSFDNEKIFESLPILDYCELRNNPDKYDGKIVRLRAGINTGNHGEFLYDTRCPADEKIKTYYDATAAVMYIDRLEQKKVTDIRSARRSKPWTDPVSVIAVGKFMKNEPTKNDSGMDRNSVFHFVIISLDAISEDEK